MKDLFGNEILPRDEGKAYGTRARITESGKKVYDTPRGYAGTPGRGPEGETCKTCEFHVRTGRFFKCLKIRHRWTHGPGTDIRLKSPACELWKFADKITPFKT